MLTFPSSTLRANFFLVVSKDILLLKVIPLIIVLNGELAKISSLIEKSNISIVYCKIAIDISRKEML